MDLGDLSAPPCWHTNGCKLLLQWQRTLPHEFPVTHYEQRLAVFEHFIATYKHHATAEKQTYADPQDNNISVFVEPHRKSNWIDHFNKPHPRHYHRLNNSCDLSKPLRPHQHWNAEHVLPINAYEAHPQFPQMEKACAFNRRAFPIRMALAIRLIPIPLDPAKKEPQLFQEWKNIRLSLDTLLHFFDPETWN